MTANRINIPPTPRTRNITIIMVSLSEAFTVVRENSNKKFNMHHANSTKMSNFNGRFNEESAEHHVEQFQGEKKEKNSMR